MRGHEFMVKLESIYLCIIDWSAKETKNHLHSLIWFRTRAIRHSFCIREVILTTTTTNNTTNTSNHPNADADVGLLWFICSKRGYRVQVQFGRSSYICKRTLIRTWLLPSVLANRIVASLTSHLVISACCWGICPRSAIVSPSEMMFVSVKWRLFRHMLVYLPNI